jgi:hypothetical protein
MEFKMFKRGFVSVALLSSIMFVSSAEAKLFKWVDKDGTTHYGEVIPPEYADRDSQTLSSKGQVKQRTEKSDPELKSANLEAAERKKAEDAATAEQKRRDFALLNTYSNEKEIDLALGRSLQLLDARVSSFTTMVKSAQETVDLHQKEVDERSKAGKKPSQSLLDDVAASESRLERLKKDLAQSEQEVINVKARFEADKVRYRELKGGSKK